MHPNDANSSWHEERRPFDDFVRSLAPEGEPSLAALDELWTALRQGLIRRLRRRGLLHRSPLLLGVVGHPTWTTVETRSAAGMPALTRDALDELAADAYGHLFVDRLDTLRRYLSTGKSIEAVVAQSLGQFLHECQKKNDPLGFRLYQWLRRALIRHVEQGGVFVLQGSGKIDNATVLAFDPVARMRATGAVLASEIQGWNLEPLLDALGSKRHGPAIESLAGGLSRLAEAGVESFSFKDLIDALKWRVRSRLAEMWSAGGAGRQADDPLRDEVQAERFQQLSACVEGRLSALQVQRRTREHLERLWRFLRAFALSTADEDSLADQGDTLTRLLESDTLPSYRKLSRLLGMRHDRVSQLLALLRGEVLTCLRELGERPAPAVRAMAAEGGGSEAQLSDAHDLREELQRRTAEAFQRSDRAEPVAVSSLPRQGQLVTLTATAGLGVEWLVLEVQPGNGRCLLVAVDSLSWLGSADRPLAAEPPAGPLTVRSAHGFWIPWTHLKGESVRGLALSTDLDRIRRHRDSVLAGSYEPDGEELEVDLDPDYREWNDTLTKAQREAELSLGGSEEASPLPRRSAVRRVAMAASVLLLIALGLLTGLFLEQRKTERQIVELEAARRSLIAERDGLAGQASELAEERSRLDAEIARLEEELQSDRQRHDRELEELERRAEERIARSLEPEVSVPWVLVPTDRVRGDPRRLVVPAGARSIALLFDAQPRDRVELRRGGRLVWSAVVDRVEGRNEVLLRLPSSLVPPGRYELLLWRQEEELGRLRLDIERD